MAREHPALSVRLVSWSEEDYPLLVRLNSPEMTEHLGGPETDEALADRHRRYLVAARSGMIHEKDSTYPAYVFKVVVEDVPVGNVNFWEREWQGRSVYEMGWGIVPEFQGRGLATEAVKAAIDVARGLGSRDLIHAFPSVDNGPSNAICRKAGFELIGPVEFEYPKGHWMQCNDWRLSLAQ